MKEGEIYFEGRVSLKAIIVSSYGRVLICRNLKDPELWDLPGGTMNSGEKPEEALLREIDEEISIVPKIMSPFKADIFIKPATGKEVFVLIYEAFLEKEPEDFVLDETEIAETKWIAKDELDGIKMFSEYKMALADFFKR